MRGLFIVTIATMALLASGCTSSPTLTPENAKVLLQQHLKAEDQAIGLVDYEPIAAMTGYKTLIDYRSEFRADSVDGIMHRLLAADLIKQTIGTYPFRPDGFGRRGRPVYQYLPSEELKDAVVIRPAGPMDLGLARIKMVKVGQIKIDRVERLRFEHAGTAARAELRWHIDCDSVGIAFADAKTIVAPNGQAFFRKEGGAWVCVRP